MPRRVHLLQAPQRRGEHLDVLGVVAGHEHRVDGGGDVGVRGDGDLSRRVPEGAVVVERHAAHLGVAEVGGVVRQQHVLKGALPDLRVAEPRPARVERVEVVPVRQAVVQRVVRVHPLPALYRERGVELQPPRGGREGDAVQGARLHVGQHDALGGALAGPRRRSRQAHRQRQLVLAPRHHGVLGHGEVRLVQPLCGGISSQRRRGERLRVHHPPLVLHTPRPAGALAVDAEEVLDVDAAADGLDDGGGAGLVGGGEHRHVGQALALRLEAEERERVHLVVHHGVGGERQRGAVGELVFLAGALGGPEAGHVGGAGLAVGDGRGEAAQLAVVAVRVHVAAVPHVRGRLGVRAPVRVDAHVRQRVHRVHLVVLHDAARERLGARQLRLQLRGVEHAGHRGAVVLDTRRVLTELAAVAAQHHAEHGVVRGVHHPREGEGAEQRAVVCHRHRHAEDVLAPGEQRVLG
mmetsp:Transcript_29166/g.72078  ORF Transcript_29166/g.72078 Transcript_29166/m.72078 type:complete len:464 (-) Transcript_29166:2793-4184(-)